MRSEKLVSLRNKLAEIWEDFLIPQDQQKFRPHITIQNKAEPEEAKNLFESLKSNWKPRDGEIIGLQLWKYVRPRWDFMSEHLFESK